MLFHKTLRKHHQQVKEAMDELFTAIERAQTHEQDLLFVEINGFYQTHLENPLPSGEKLSPFVFGVGGWSYMDIFIEIETAIEFDKFNKSGVVRVDLNKVSSPYDVYWQHESMPNKAYWLSKFHTETSVYQHVPQSAVKTYMPFPVKLDRLQ